MSRKRTSLSRSIADLAASMPALNPGDHTDHESEFISVPLEEGVVEPTIPISAEPPVSTNAETELPPPLPPTDLELPPTANELFRRWYLTPEGRRVTDTRLPTDPIRLGSTLDDNARIAFMAGFNAARP